MRNGPRENGLKYRDSRAACAKTRQLTPWHGEQYFRAEASLKRRNRRWFVHVLSLALFIAQLGMVLHASSHLVSDPHATPTQSQLCGECASFSPMQNMVGGAPIVVLEIPVFHDAAFAGPAVASVPHRAFSAFRSRAPPVS
jgi:hypothetical protein